MKKNITKEQIVTTALDLMRTKNDIRGLNLREIARALGCAHTNPYNYFPSYTDLLWETHATSQEQYLITSLREIASRVGSAVELQALDKAFHKAKYPENNPKLFFSYGDKMEDELYSEIVQEIRLQTQGLDIHRKIISQMELGEYSVRVSVLLALADLYQTPIQDFFADLELYE